MGKYGCVQGLCDGKGISAPSAGLIPYGLTPRPFCRCFHGYACHRCSRRTRELQLGLVKCPCDAPSLSKSGGHFKLKLKKKENLTLTIDERPYNTLDECEVMWRFTPC